MSSFPGTWLRLPLLLLSSCLPFLRPQQLLTFPFLPATSSSPPLSPGSENHSIIYPPINRTITHRRSPSPSPLSPGGESEEVDMSPSSSPTRPRSRSSLDTPRHRNKRNGHHLSISPAPPQSPGASSTTSSTKEGSTTSSTATTTSNAPNPFADGLKERCNCEELSRVECILENKDLWDKFNELGTEMIITKCGR